MFEAFKETCASMFNRNDKILLAVSGGIDSMVMFHLFSSTDYHFAVAHCNFSLRGEESDGDTALVERVCRERGVELHKVRFDTYAEMDRSGDSLQMAARNLRYDWFDRVCDEYGYTKIAVAHNSGDTIETFFINMLRGTGVRGLTGIAAVRERIVRPIMMFSREDIVHYAHSNGVKWRDDSSNSGVKYLRNKIRHIIIPEFNKIEPNFTDVMLSDISKVRDAVSFIDGVVGKVRNKAFSYYRGRITLSLSIVAEYEPLDFILYELLSPYGFNYSVVKEIVRCYEEGEEGREFKNERISALLSRGLLIMSDNGFIDSSSVYTISRIDVPYPLSNGELKFEELNKGDIKSFKEGCNVAFFDADRLILPFTVRTWVKGDSFVPFGMNGHKKLSDYFVDTKVNLLDKNRCKILLNGNGDIIWLIGLRSDNRYRVMEDTKKVLKISYNE